MLQIREAPASAAGGGAGSDPGTHVLAVKCPWVVPKLLSSSGDASSQDNPGCAPEKEVCSTTLFPPSTPRL